jgi:hypothetical protein
MTRPSHEAVSERANQTASELLLAIDNGDVRRATELAEDLWCQGIQSLPSLSPRGTVKTPARDRWNRTAEFIDRLTRGRLPDCLSISMVKDLGVWAGSQALAPIHRIADRDRTESVELTMAVLYAAHLIGGPDALRILNKFEEASFPEEIRDAAARYRNALGSPVVDLMFGPEIEHT